jgi:hypothetical protein
MSMERLLAKAALWDAIAGCERVLVLCPSEVYAADVLASARNLIPEGYPADVRLTNGDKSITFPDGGLIRFRSVRSSLRGYSFDQVYLPAATGPETKEDAQIAVATSRIGTLTEY